MACGMEKDCVAHKRFKEQLCSGLTAHECFDDKSKNVIITYNFWLTAHTVGVNSQCLLSRQLENSFN